MSWDVSHRVWVSLPQYVWHIAVWYRHRGWMSLTARLSSHTRAVQFKRWHVPCQGCIIFSTLKTHGTQRKPSKPQLVRVDWTMKKGALKKTEIQPTPWMQTGYNAETLFWSRCVKERTWRAGSVTTDEQWIRREVFPDEREYKDVPIRSHCSIHRLKMRQCGWDAPLTTTISHRTLVTFGGLPDARSKSVFLTIPLFRYFSVLCGRASQIYSFKLCFVFSLTRPK